MFSNLCARILQEPLSPLCHAMNEEKSDKGSGEHNYTKLYYKLFGRRCRQPLRILEFGIGTVNAGIESTMVHHVDRGYRPGASARGWRLYFPNAHIYVCDVDQDAVDLVNDEARAHGDDRMRALHVDQRSSSSVAQMLEHARGGYIEGDDVDESVRAAEMRAYDIVVDDGLHEFETNMHVMRLVLGKCALADHGYYIVEDVIDYDERHVPREFLKKHGYEYEYVEMPHSSSRVDNNLFIVHYTHKPHKEKDAKVSLFDLTQKTHDQESKNE